VVYKYNEFKVMEFTFSLLRIKGLYMFRALRAHPQEALHKRHLVYCVRVTSVGCTRTKLEPVRFTLTLAHALHLPSAAFVAIPEDEQVMLETYRGP
jgi:hypothetical protein